MKWFKHDCDMHTDLKVQNLLEKHGLEGYAIFNISLEMVGKEGKGGRLDGQLRWRQLIAKIACMEDNGKLEGIFQTMADLRLIDPKALKYGNLYIPKFIKRADDYTLRKLRTTSEYSTDNVRVDKNRIDKIRIEYITIKGWLESDLKPDDYGRLHKAIKTLLLKANDDGAVIEALHWIESVSAGKWEWTLETLVKKWQDYLAYSKMSSVEKKYMKKGR